MKYRNPNQWKKWMWIWNNLLEETQLIFVNMKWSSQLQLVFVVWGHPTHKALSHAPIARQRAYIPSYFLLLSTRYKFVNSILQFAEKRAFLTIFDLVQLLATHLEIVALAFIFLLWHLLSCILLPIKMSLIWSCLFLTHGFAHNFLVEPLSLVLLPSNTWYVNKSNSYPKVSLWSLWTKELLNYDFFASKKIY